MPQTERTLTRLALLLAIVTLLLPGCRGATEPEGAELVPPDGDGMPPDLPMGCEAAPVPDGDFALVGDAKACKGGTFVYWVNSYPTHLNYYGPERDASLASNYTEAMFNTLISVHLNTLEVIPELASSWEETDGGKEIIFHLDPDARWSDGKPITAQDVVHTYELIQHPKVVEAFLKSQFDEHFEAPIIIDDHTVKFVGTKASWRNILFFDDIYIYPAHATDPETFLEEWRFEQPVLSGAYTLGEHETGKFFKLERRPDFWGWGKRTFTGIYNFDTIYYKFIRDTNLAWEVFKKGEIDWYLVTRAQRWAEETDFEKTQKGWIQKTRMYNNQPEVPSQMAFNLEYPLFQDVRVRKGMMYLYNREYLHDQLFFNQYANKNSYWENSMYANPDNETITFSPEKGVASLREAGWTEKDSDGILMKDGQRFEFDFLYIHPSAERTFTPVQETFRKYGIKMNLTLISPSAWGKVLDKKDFAMTYILWGAVPFPNPRDAWHSEMATTEASSNITKFHNDRVDELIELYERESDLQVRAKYIQEIDGIVYPLFPYLLDWYGPFFRNMWWDKFGFPEWMSYASLDIRRTHWKTWWFEENRAVRLEQARANGVSIPLAAPENTHWK